MPFASVLLLFLFSEAFILLHGDERQVSLRVQLIRRCSKQLRIHDYEKQCSMHENMQSNGGLFTPVMHMQFFKAKIVCSL